MFLTHLLLPGEDCMERWNVRGHAHDQNDIGVSRHVPEANSGAHTTSRTVPSPRRKHSQLVSE